jgi:hypothetical protein
MAIAVRTRKMKKNILLSIVLCFGLLIPHASFASETGQDWYETLRSGLSKGAQTLSSYLPEAPSVPTWAKKLVNRLSDNQKLALFTALATALGLGYSIYSAQTQKEDQQEQKYPQFEPVNENKPYDIVNLRNMGKFLNWADLKKSQHRPNSYEIAFDYYIYYPILTKLSLPDTDWYNASYKVELEAYTVWSNLMNDVRKNSKLEENDENCLRKIQFYLGLVNDDAFILKLKNSLYAAFNHIKMEKEAQKFGFTTKINKDINALSNMINLYTFLSNEENEGDWYPTRYEVVGHIGFELIATKPIVEFPQKASQDLCKKLFKNCVYPVLQLLKLPESDNDTKKFWSDLIDDIKKMRQKYLANHTPLDKSNQFYLQAFLNYLENCDDCESKDTLIKSLHLAVNQAETK